MWNVEILTRPEDFPALEAEWEDLLARSDTDTPFMSFAWFSWWYRERIERASPLVALVREDGRLRAIVPLRFSRARFRHVHVRILGLATDFYSCRFGIVAEPFEEPIWPLVLAALRERGIRFDLWDLEYILEGSWTDRQIRAYLKTSPRPIRVRPGNVSPYIILDGTWDDYWKGLTRNMRANIRHAANRLQKAGPFHMGHIRLPQDVPRLIDEYFEVEERSWKARSGILVSRSEISVRRFGQVLRLAAERGWLNAGTLYFEGRPIAMVINLDYKDASYCLFTNFDEAYGRLSPGLFVLSEAIRDCCASGRKIFDWMGRNDAYKLKYTRLTRSNVGYYIFEKTWRGRLARLSDRWACRWMDERRERRGMRSAV